MNKVILVTGASSGIGKAVATYLSKQHYIVYGASRTARPSDDFETIRMDVTDREMVRSAIDEIYKKEGRIDGVLNNAGIGSVGAFENVDQEDFQKVFDINVHGTINVCQAVLPIMREQGSGHLINISSIGSVMGLPFRSIYCSSKAAVDIITETIRLEVNRFGIEVCLVHPGDVRTEIGQRRVISAPEDDKVYGNQFRRTFEELERDVEKGLSPEVFGPVVDKILKSRKVNRNYYVGYFTQKLGMRLKKVLPDFLFEKIIMSYYKAED